MVKNCDLGLENAFYFVFSRPFSDPLEIPPSRLLGPYETSFGSLTQQIINQ